jgi:site-specific DNA-methyltransferase (adenine-specific)
MKPAHEPICVARKPIEKGLTIAQNCLKWGTGGINIDGSRVGLSDQDDSRLGGKGTFKTDKAAKNIYEGGYEGKDIASSPLGRFPANIIHDGSEEVINCFPDTKKGSDKPRNRNTVGSFGMPNNTTQEYSDSGNASRFFKSILYYPKASKAEKNKGCEELDGKPVAHSNQAKAELKRGNTDFSREVDTSSFNSVKMLKNSHPTVKPVALIAYLIKLVTPKGGITLDPFGGSGTHAVASIENGFKYILIEKEAEHIPIIEARIKAATKEENTAEDKQPINQLSLF